MQLRTHLDHVRDSQLCNAQTSFPAAVDSDARRQVETFSGSVETVTLGVQTEPEAVAVREVSDAGTTTAAFVEPCASKLIRQNFYATVGRRVIWILPLYFSLYLWLSSKRISGTLFWASVSRLIFLVFQFLMMYFILANVCMERNTWWYWYIEYPISATDGSITRIISCEITCYLFYMIQKKQSDNVYSEFVSSIFSRIHHLTVIIRSLSL